VPEDCHWDPLSPEEAASLLGALAAPWWVAGGFAIDLHLERTTRAHGDLDIAVLRDAQPQLRACLEGWDIQVAYDGQLTPWQDGDWLTPPRHQFWARPSPDAPWALEFLLEDHHGDAWVYRRDAAVTMPLDRFGRTSPEGIPYVCPEVALLYKAKGFDVPRNAADFDVATPSLDADARAWLRDALERTHAGHPWIARL
jgi:hypothetical protein